MNLFLLQLVGSVKASQKDMEVNMGGVTAAREADRKNISSNVRNYQRTQMQRELIIQKLREQGCRITKQRLMLLDIILEEDCSCCKEIFYKASRLDKRIGTATVYRMINTLEEIGAISRKNMYKIACGSTCDIENACTIEFDDDTVIELSAKSWHQIIESGLAACGYMEGRSVRSVAAKSCDCEAAKA